MGLCLAGALFVPVAYFVINSVPLTAVGISTTVIGFVCIALANARPYVSPEACDLMLKAGMANTAALVEELGLQSKAVYLSSKMGNGHPQALVPLTDKTIHLVKYNLPRRLMVRYGVEPDDMAIAVTTPGSLSIGVLKTKPRATSSEIEAAATYILSGLLDLADSVSVDIAGDRVTVTVSGPRLQYEDTRFYRCLGSPMASIVAAVSSEALEKPIRILEEDHSRGKSRIILEVLP